MFREALARPGTGAGLLPFLVTAISILAPIPVAAQSQSPAPVTVVTLGGFLGYLDGQRAAPGERYGWTSKPRGGVLGAADWLAAHRKPGDIFVLGANNLPHDSSRDKLREAVLAIGQPPATYATAGHPALRPDAVGFGIDDFLRALKPGRQAGALFDALADPKAPPFVISNALVRLSKKHLNVNSAGGFHLDIPRDESVDWLASLELTCHPCPNMSVTLEERTAAGTSQVPLDALPDRSYRRVTLALRTALRPSAVYQLKLAPHSGRRSATLSFHTHMAIAPATTSSRASSSPELPRRVRGLPIRYLTRPAAVVVESAPGADGADSCAAAASVQAPIAIVGVVDPTLKSRLGAELWTWTGDSCPIGSCTIDFVAPLDAITAIKSWLSDAEPCVPSPTYVLLSGLSDEHAGPVIAQHPDIRWVILDYDSRALGQFRGRDAVINQTTPDSTQLWARLQWVGSSATTLSAGLTWKRRPGDADRPSTWEFQAPAVRTEVVEGRALAWTLTPRVGRPPAIAYFLEGDPTTSIAGPMDTYAPFPGMLSPRISQGRMWTDLADMTAFVLDIMRERGHADVAMLPADFVDEETLAWLASEYQRSGKPLDWLSRFVAARMFFREERIVTAEISGSALIGAVNRIIEAGEDRDISVYGAGFGINTALTPLEDKEPRINGRELERSQFYRVAMPQSLAEEQGLNASHVVMSSLIDEIERRLRPANGATPSTTGSLGEQLEEQVAGRSRVYLSATSARVDFSQEDVREGNAGAFGKIPLEGRSAQTQEQWGFAGRAEAGVDYRAVAYRLLGEATFGRQTIGGTVSYPSDEWTAGLRIDLKPGRLGLHRVFGGLFRQSWFSDHGSALTPVRTVTNVIDPNTNLRVPDVTISGPSVTPRVLKPQFDFFRGGVDIDAQSWKALTIRDVAVAFDVGSVHRDRDSLRIANGPVLELDRLFRDGLGTLLNEAFALDPIGFAANPRVVYGYANHDQRRLQVDGALDLAPASALHGIRWSVAARYRKYFDGADRINFTPDESLIVTSSIGWTLFTRVKVGPFVDYYRVEAKGASGPFSDRKVGVALETPLHLALRPGAWLR